MGKRDINHWLYTRSYNKNNEIIWENWFELLKLKRANPNFIHGYSLMEKDNDINFGIVEWFDYSNNKSISENIIEFIISRSCDINSDFILHSLAIPKTIQVLIGGTIVKELHDCKHIKIDIPIIALIFSEIKVKAIFSENVTETDINSSLLISNQIFLRDPKREELASVPIIMPYGRINRGCFT